MSRLEEVLALCDLRQCLLAHIDSPCDLRRLGMASHSTSAACLAYLSGNKQAGRQLLDTAVCSCVNAFERCTGEIHCVERRLEHCVDSVRWLQGVCNRGLVLRAQHVAALSPVLLWYRKCWDFQPKNSLDAALWVWSIVFWSESWFRGIFWFEECIWLGMGTGGAKQTLSEVLEGLQAECSHDGVLRALPGRAALRRDPHSQQKQQQRWQQRQQHQQLQSRSKWQCSRRCPRKLVYHKR